MSCEQVPHARKISDFPEVVSLQHLGCVEEAVDPIAFLANQSLLLNRLLFLVLGVVLGESSCV